MPTVDTVTGPLQASQLGRVLMHEHVTLGTTGLRDNYPDLLVPRAEVEDICVAKLTRLKEAGVSTLVDHTTFDIGRDAELLARVSQRSGVQIVAATGVWITAPRWFQKRGADEIAALFIGDLTAGIGHTGIKAGIIKCALDKAGLEPALEQILRASARAHIATGGRISTHTWAAGRSGDIQQRIFAEEGADLGQVLIGHCGDTEDYGYLRGLLEKGSYIGMDRFGIQETLSDERRSAVVATLCRDGFAERMMLSQDANSWSDRDAGLAVSETRSNWHYHNVLDNILPMLRRMGVTDEQIDVMMCGNPRRFFGGA